MKLFIFLSIFLSTSFYPVITFADNSTQDFLVDYSISDGKDGRIFKQWHQYIGEKPVRSIDIKVRRESGSRDTYLNLRFGNGATFENGKRAQVDGTQTVSWNVGGEKSNGQELVLNAHNGEVFIESVRVNFDSDPQYSSRKPEREKIDDDSDKPSDVDPNAYNNCRTLYRIGRPIIEINRVKPTGNIFSGDQKVEGSIYAQCVQEAGYYESGRLKERIDFSLNDRFNRKEFNLRSSQNQNGEIRVYTTDGQQETYSLK